MMTKQIAVFLSLTTVSSLRGNDYKSFSCCPLDTDLVSSKITTILIFPLNTFKGYLLHFSTSKWGFITFSTLIPPSSPGSRVYTPLPVGQMQPAACFAMASAVRMVFTFLKSYIHKYAEESVCGPQNLKYYLVLYRKSLSTFCSTLLT